MRESRLKGDTVGGLGSDGELRTIWSPCNDMPCFRIHELNTTASMSGILPQVFTS